MTFEESGLYYIRGIVSVAEARHDGRMEKSYLCNPNEYVIFTDVAQYLPWIEEVLQIVHDSNTGRCENLNFTFLDPYEVQASIILILRL